MARFGIGFDAEERGSSSEPKLIDQPAEIYVVEDLAQIALAKLRRELDPRAFADAAPGVFTVLRLPQLGGRGELLVVCVCDAGGREGSLQPLGVRPRVLRAA